MKAWNMWVEFSKEFGVAHNIISKIWKNKDAVKEQFQKNKLNFKKNTRPKYQDIETALLIWFKNQRVHNIPIKGPLLESKRKNSPLYWQKIDFECSHSRVQRFRARNIITLGKISEESADVPIVTSVVWPKIRENYVDNDIFNIDQLGLFSRFTNILRFKGEKCSGDKLSKDR